MKCQAIPEYLLTKGIFNCQKYIAEEKMKFFTTIGSVNAYLLTTNISLNGTMVHG